MKVLNHFEFGVYLTEDFNREKIYSDQLPKGYVYQYVEAPVLISKSTKISLENGIEFGIQFYNEEDEDFWLMVKILHPEIENEDKLSFTEHQYNILCKSYEDTFFLQTIEEKWEMMPGYWTFQIWDNNHLFFEKEFEIYFDKSDDMEVENYFYDM